MTTVAAALIQRQGLVLICRRRADQDHAGKWEFPGGKLERGETPDHALSVPISRPKEIQLVFFSVVEYRGEPDYGMFAEVRWVPVEQMPSFEFLEGDVEFVRALATGGFDLSGPSGN